MKSIVFLFCFGFIANASLAQSYAVYLIDTTLLKNANAVVRLEDEQYELRNLEKLVYRYKRAITILNEKGEEHSGLVVGYDPFRSIENLDGTLFDEDGKKIRTLKKGEVKDFSGTDGMSLADDSRVKAHSFYHRTYPYTVEYEYTVVKKETMFFPQWFPQTDQYLSVEESRFSLILPADYQLRYKGFNYDAKPVITNQSGKAVYQWTVKKLPAVRIDFAFPGWRYVAPMVITGASDFQIDDYKGRMTNWEELGRFQMAMNQGRDVLPDPIKQQVHELIAGKQSTREKVEALYHFLQKNTRYISIQLGVGGWRPFEASYVAKNKYGDCKALSNYMYSLLKEAGILSYYTLVRAGQYEEEIVADFPSRQFNHVILCVPMEKDTVWLECTSQDQVPGYMGGFTGNRHALLVTPEGGKLVRTPTYGLRENRQITKVKAVVEPNGNMIVEQNAQYSGIPQDLYHDLMNSLSKDKLKQFLNENIDLATYDIVDFKYDQEKRKVPVVNEYLKLSISNYAQVTGKRIFVVPNISNRTGLKLDQSERKYPIKLWNEFVESDSVDITVPAGYKVEALPNTVVLESKFGKYQASYKVENNTITYYRRFERYSGIFENTLYADLVKFYEQLYKADRNKIVLVKNE
ncbi:MAG TPA: DUF3857 domain-containing protein [Chitinophagaceae bacterium]